MKIIQASLKELTLVEQIARDTILAVYPRYYPQEAVESFLDYHRGVNIATDIGAGNVYLLEAEGEVVATGSVKENYMIRVFVQTEFQQKGYGSAMMDFIEGMIGKNYDTIRVDASLPGYKVYLKRGYTPVGYGEHPCKNGRILFYPTLEKPTIRSTTAAGGKRLHGESTIEEIHGA